jgi:hypothetical protein
MQEFNLSNQMDLPALARKLLTIIMGFRRRLFEKGRIMQVSRKISTTHVMAIIIALVLGFGMFFFWSRLAQ